MKNMDVTYDDMRTAATNLKNGQSEIEATLAKLQSLVDQLVAGGYVTDRSSKEFEASYSEFNAGAKQTIEGLTGMGMYLEKAAEVLEGTDEDLANALRQ